ncbi:MAG TPA: hypothetical protein PKD37_03190 [Oligoflexia bacterium]|nr:hypothetical protein [Oligoflexia bacterium]HMP26973.1 hypothetical protein [Oligoflexia bacterium]
MADSNSDNSSQFKSWDLIFGGKDNAKKSNSNKNSEQLKNILNSKRKHITAQEIQASDLPVFQKVKEILAKTDPKRWERVGEKLSEKAKHQKPFVTWETGYILDLKSGVLLIRKSEVVQSQFFGGGYSLQPNGEVNYTVELKPLGWISRFLTDPFYRGSSAQKKDEGKVLLDGIVAEKLHNEVEAIVSKFTGERKELFDRETQALVSNIREEIINSDPQIWKKDSSIPSFIILQGWLKGLFVELSADFNDKNKTGYELKISREEMSFSPSDQKLAEELFLLLDQRLIEASLNTLKQVLEDSGL